MVRSTARRISSILLILVIALPIQSISGEGGDGGQPAGDVSPTRSIVTIDGMSTRILSGGISQWGPYSLGIVNKTTIIETRLKNTLDASFTGIEVNLTLYWYDANKGFSFDKGRVMHRDYTLASVGPGDGTLSPLIKFSWVPMFAGAYVMNISIHIPSDPHPFTNRSLIAGLQYRLGNKVITDGLWVGTEAWDCSAMDGWTVYSDMGESGMEWHVSNHSLTQGYGTLHTPGGSFWVGHEDTGLSPLNGSYSLVSPVLNMSRFNNDPWNSFLGKRYPQIYLLYRYRGNISARGPNGVGGIYHWIRSREGEGWGNWEPLLDPREKWVNISGNTSNVIWDWAKRPYLQGDLDFIGVDLGGYQGKDVQVRFEYRPSGNPETGYVLDDLMLIGKEPVDITPFSVKGYTKTVPDADPGSNVSFYLTVSSPSRSGYFEDVMIRTDSVSASDFIDVDRDISIDPWIFLLHGGSGEDVRVNVTLSVPRSAPSGQGWFTVRILGGGIYRDVTFAFIVRSRNRLEFDISGEMSGPISPGGVKHLTMRIDNLGNVVENVRVGFLTDTELVVVPGQMGPRQLEPGEIWSVELNVSVPVQSSAGWKRGFMVMSGNELPPDAFEMIIDGSPRDGWQVRELNFTVKQYFEISLFAPSSASTYREIKDPRNNGSEEIFYDLVVRNSGNGIDSITITSPGVTGGEDILPLLPENVSVDPGATQFIRIMIRVTFPVPIGIYDMDVVARSSGQGDDPTDNGVTLRLSIGRAPVSRGIYLLNGSLEIRPTDLILGREAVVFFTVRSFGFLQSDSFNVNLWLDGKVILSRQLNISQFQSRDYQLTWNPDISGNHTLNVTLSEGKELGPEVPDLVLGMGSSVKIGYIDMGICNITMRMGKDTGETPLEPGDHDVIITICNHGDTAADLAMVTLDIQDRTLGTARNFTMNVTDVPPGGTRDVVFRNIHFDTQKSYILTSTILNSNRWREMETDDDTFHTDVEVGKAPENRPIWRDPVWGIAGFVLTLLVTVGMFLYLLRKKL